VLNSERFCDLAPAQVWAILLDEGRYLCSVSTMDRILRSRHQVRERRRQARHPAHVKPELVAPRESARLAEELIAASAHAERIDPGQLTLHADRGTSMTSRTVAQLLADLGVTGSHSRSALTAKPSSTMPTRPTPTAFTADQPHPPSPRLPGSTNPNRICLRSHPWSRAMTVPSYSPRWSGGSAPAGHLAARRPLHASR
jgi:hypothetical protein